MSEKEKEFLDPSEDKESDATKEELEDYYDDWNEDDYWDGEEDEEDASKGW